MNTIINWIRGHQVLAFFIIVYAIAWPVLFLVYFIFPGNDVVTILAMPFIPFSPAISGMLISGIAEPRPKYESSKPRWIAFIVSWLISAPIIILHAKNNMGVDSVSVFIAFGIMGIFPAWVLSSVYARTHGVRKLFSTLLRPRGPAIWYQVIFLVFPGFVLLGFYITRALGGEAQFYLVDLGGERLARFCYSVVADSISRARSKFDRRVPVVFLASIL